MANFLLGTPSRFERIKKFDPQRGAAFGDILQQALSGLQEVRGDFAPIAEREVSRFKRETVPSIAQRFTTMGAQSRGSGLEEALQRGGADLSTSLAALGSQHGLQRQGQLMQLLGMGLTPQEDIGYFTGTQGLLGSAASGIGQGLGTLAGGAGGGILQFLMSLFGGGRNQQQGSGSVSMDQSSLF